MDQRPSLSQQAPAPVAELGDAGGDQVGGGWGGHEVLVAIGLYRAIRSFPALPSRDPCSVATTKTQ